MSISDPNSVDIIQIDQASKSTHLIMTDHLRWDGDASETEHLWQVQEKVNSYLKYIESGQLDADYPDQRGYDVILQVYGKYDRTPSAVSFYDQLKAVLLRSDYRLEFILKD